MVTPEARYECRICDGQKVVEVTRICDILGEEHCLMDFYPLKRFTVDCPNCDGSGEEPKSDPYNDPRIP